MIRLLLSIMGWGYIFLERFVSYPNDGEILGVKIDEDFQKMSRRELCEYIDSTNTENDSNITFWDLDSTTKIRYGCQLARLCGLEKDD